jgi:uncharacterized protein
MSAPKPPRAWQRMLSGRRLNLLDPSPLDIEIEDIAHGLSRVARWNGQTKGAHPFSVAQHSLAVEQLMVHAEPNWLIRWRLAALLHDAPEYVVGDLISPFKAALGLDYKAFENRLLAAVHTRFGLPETLPAGVTKAIKAADRLSAHHEARLLAGFSPAEANEFFGEPGDIAGLEAVFAPWPPDEAQRLYLAKFRELASGAQ